mmetsp:Transcript_59762/g.165301  ORF Transcript_59762/g.165301 Transcript_59762/m.165301 type:complete len:193 (-) Transcript_59762:922-1500(-)
MCERPYRSCLGGPFGRYMARRQFVSYDWKLLVRFTSGYCETKWLIDDAVASGPFISHIVTRKKSLGNQPSAVNCIEARKRSAAETRALLRKSDNANQKEMYNRSSSRSALLISIDCSRLRVSSHISMTFDAATNSSTSAYKCGCLVRNMARSSPTNLTESRIMLCCLYLYRTNLWGKMWARTPNPASFNQKS